MKEYIVITADIVDSKKIGNINELDKLLKKLNSLIDDKSIMKFKLSRGDEIQAIFKKNVFIPEIIRLMLYSFYPINLRIGIGIGEIPDEKLKIKNSWNSNGEAFYNARKAIDILEKKDKKNKTKKISSIFLKSSNDFFDDCFNSFYILNFLNYNRWKQTQWDAIQSYEKLENLEKSANELKISFSAVQQRIASANWLFIKEAEEIFYFRILKQLNNSRKKPGKTIIPGKNLEK
ncbi:MAG: SatD family protein [Psychrilyobacter sp.]|uniref:SatD family protein n=1 Tax=Psychrilyobacter sp. TaxID=2586924 RepID=UPI003C7896C3